MTIDERTFSGIDLNLLLVFMVLFREQNVSRAAECLHVKQPAVSGSLSRLRLQFNDPLFIRVGPRGVRPTEKASQMAQALMPAMSAIQAIVNRPAD
ncbi:LysR family transcriptional regulator [Pseudomonas sp. NPDC090202]